MTKLPALNQKGVQNEALLGLLSSIWTFSINQKDINLLVGILLSWFWFFWGGPKILVTRWNLGVFLRICHQNGLTSWIKHLSFLLSRQWGTESFSKTRIHRQTRETWNQLSRDVLPIWIHCGNRGPTSLSWIENVNNNYTWFNCTSRKGLLTHNNFLFRLTHAFDSVSLWEQPLLVPK